MHQHSYTKQLSLLTLYWQISCTQVIKRWEVVRKNICRGVNKTELLEFYDSWSEKKLHFGKSNRGSCARPNHGMFICMLINSVILEKSVRESHLFAK